VPKGEKKGASPRQGGGGSLRSSHHHKKKNERGGLFYFCAKKKKGRMKSLGIDNESKGSPLVGEKKVCPLLSTGDSRGRRSWP